MTTEQVPIKEFTLTHVMTNVSQMKLDVHTFTERVNQCNVPWTMASAQTATHFSLYVHCEKDRDPEVDWSITARIHSSVNSANGKSYFKSYIAPYNNRNNSSGFGIGEFVPLEELRQKMLIEDELVVEAKVEILEMTGIELPPRLKNFDDDEARNMSDVTLLVGDRQFYVSKFTLAQQSTYFKSLFFGSFKESKQSKVTLKDINPDVFQVYLEVLHVEPALTDSNVEDVLHLSQMYDSKNVTRLCEDFLLLKSDLSNKKKIQLGCKFNLKDLKNSCLDSLETAADVRACLGCGGLANGPKDADILNLLAEKSLSFLMVD